MIINRPKRAAVKDIHVDIADILGQKYWYRIDIGKGDIDIPLYPISTDWYISALLAAPFARSSSQCETYMICVHRHADVAEISCEIETRLCVSWQPINLLLDNCRVPKWVSSTQHSLVKNQCCCCSQAVAMVTSSSGAIGITVQHMLTTAAPPVEWTSNYSSRNA